MKKILKASNIVLWCFLCFILIIGGYIWADTMDNVHYLHEFGHVLAGYLSGGGGYIVHGGLAQVAGIDTFTSMGGSFFAFWLGTAILLIAIRFKVFYLGAPFIGSGYWNMILFYGTVDQVGSRISNAGWTFIFVVSILLQIIVVTLMFYRVYIKGLQKKRNWRKIVSEQRSIRG